MPSLDILITDEQPQWGYQLPESRSQTWVGKGKSFQRWIDSKAVRIQTRFILRGRWASPLTLKISFDNFSVLLQRHWQ